MAEPDSWEDMESSAAPTPAPAPPPPAASASPSFFLNPSAPSFTPSFSPSFPPASNSKPSSFPPPIAFPPSEVSAPFLPVPVAVPSPAPNPESASGPFTLVDSATTDSSPAHMATGSSVSENGCKENDSMEVDQCDGFVDSQKQAIDPTTTEQADKAADSLASMKLKETHSIPEGQGVAAPGIEKLVEPMEQDSDKRLHLNVVFIGHVDAGKSTIGGQILYLTGMVDERTIQKYEKEAKEKNRESWYMAYIMDTNEEERAKGITVEVGRAYFETAKTRFTILDCPGHKNYVPNMISGASQADVGVLVISARRGEFETGFERGGQTREHAQLAKTLGVSKLLVVVNKMDDLSVQWSKERFDEVEKKMVPFLRSCGYNVKKDVRFLPISGLLGSNMKERLDRSLCPWWDGPCLFEALDAIEPPARDPGGPFRMPLIDKFKDMGTVVMGKLESGSVRRGDALIVMPNKAHVKVVTVYRDNDEVSFARPGENLRIRLSGVEEEDISPGFVLSSVSRPIPAVLEFDAQLQILELLEHKSIFTAGYTAVLHLHSVVEECEIIELLQQIDPQTKKAMRKKAPLKFVKSGSVVVVRIQVNQLICVEKFDDFPQLGRFTLRDEGKTVAIGKVVNLPTLTNQE